MKLQKLSRLGLYCIGAGMLSAGMLFAGESAASRLRAAAEVMNEVMATPDKGIPQELLENSQCVVIVPGMKKGAFIIGAKYGKGFLLCRKASGKGWSAPAAIMVEGGSFGFQIGGSETDVVMLVMNKGGVEKLLSSKFTLGADASVAAGPVGRTSSANTDLQLHAEILSYSRARGLFAGIALDGATLRPDEETNKELYGSKITNREIVTGTETQKSMAGTTLTADMDKYSLRNK
ncbi:MAG TPA: lipid-binding SYLF domain-containing protein [Acidobacteriota bacterium]|nr:lipid-binding SYLF domain-containing protein [Acidobacteriota bacterium]